MDLRYIGFAYADRYFYDRGHPEKLCGTEQVKEFAPLRKWIGLSGAVARPIGSGTSLFLRTRSCPNRDRKITARRLPKTPTHCSRASRGAVAEVGLHCNGGRCPPLDPVRSESGSCFYECSSTPLRPSAQPRCMPLLAGRYRTHCAIRILQRSRWVRVPPRATRNVPVRNVPVRTRGDRRRFYPTGRLARPSHQTRSRSSLPA